MAKQRYYSKEFARERWHVMDRQTGLPVYDNAPDAQDKPLVFTDPDKVVEYVAELNATANN